MEAGAAGIARTMVRNAPRRRGRARKPKPLCLQLAAPAEQVQRAAQLPGEPADIILHPDTAAAHGIADGQKVRVHNRSGEIILVAKVHPVCERASPRSRTGMSMPMSIS